MCCFGGYEKVDIRARRLGGDSTGEGGKERGTKGVI